MVSKQAYWDREQYRHIAEADWEFNYTSFTLTIISRE